MNIKQLTVILPAAGKGSRLNLPYSKELYQINGRASIDHSFNQFRDVDKSLINFVVVNNNKNDIKQYLSETYPGHNIFYVDQRPELQEYTGAILSAYQYLQDYNIVLLPDSVAVLNSNNFYYDTLNVLESNNFCWWAKYTNDSRVLSTKGALEIKDKKCKFYLDKPKNNFSNFNAFWCAFAFRKNYFYDFMDYFHQITIGKIAKDFTTTAAFDAPCLTVDEYYDLGTWCEIEQYKSYLKGQKNA